VQGCLANKQDHDPGLQRKLNYQLNTTNKFQLLMQSDRKLRNNRSANSETAPETSFSQYSAGGVWHFQDPTIQLTHTWLPTDKLVFVNQVTHVQGGFFLDGTTTRRAASQVISQSLPARSRRVRPVISTSGALQQHDGLPEPCWRVWRILPNPHGRRGKSRPTTTTSSRTSSVATTR